MSSLLQRGVHKLGSLFIKLVTRPKLVNPQCLLPKLKSGDRVYYILETDRLSHKLLLRNLLAQQNRQVSEHQILLADSKGQAPLRESMIELVDTLRSNDNIATYIVPVAIFHGRLPGREDSWLNLLYAETWHKAGPFGSMLQLLVNGRQTLVKVDQALDLKQLVVECEDNAAVARKAARVLRTHFSITRQSIIGPDLSHRRTLISLILNDPKVQEAIDHQAAERNTNRYRIERHCTRTLDKIAANFSPTTARILNSLFNRMWGRLYRDVRIHNIEAIQEIAKTHQLVYLPCHRSHMDYLLLSWALYRHGLMIPHVAAGENLNIPVVGPILKRGGAIFMRRKFQGDPLYACLYKTYLEQMSHRGHSLEYFIEGGRSRTGRLLPAKTGLLSMSIESYRENNAKPVALIPVWIGYDRLVESKSYQQELAGSAKQKESVLNFFSTLKILKQNFGDTLLSFGRPVTLEEHCDSDRPLKQDVSSIATEVMQRINQASGITQSSLLATSMLAGSQLQSVAELSDKSSRLLALLSDLYPDTGLLPQGKPSDWIQDAQSMGQVQQKLNLVEINQAQAQELSFYRNNIQHMLVLPALTLFLSHRLQKPHTQTLNRTIRMIYPFLKTELFLPYSEKELTVVLRDIREQLLEHNLLEQPKNNHWQVSSNALVNTLILTVEPLLLRYYIVLRALHRHEEISRGDLIEISQKIAEEIHQEYGYTTPDYKDQRVLKAFIDQLQAQGLVETRSQRLRLCTDTDSLFKQADKILRPHMLSLIETKLGRV